MPGLLTGGLGLGAGPGSMLTAGLATAPAPEADGAIFEDIRARIEATGQFLAVYLEEPEGATFEAPTAIVEDPGLYEQDPFAVGIDRRTVEYQVTVILPLVDEAQAETAAHLRTLENRVRSALDHQRFAGITHPPWTRLRSWNRTSIGKRPDLIQDRYRVSLARGTFGYPVRIQD
jgi:hypothetical protein